MRVLGLVAMGAIASLAVPSDPAGAGSGSHEALAIIEHIFGSAHTDQDGILTSTEYEQAEYVDQGDA